MNRFCGCSRQQVNFQKCQIFFSTNVENQLADKLSTFSGIPHSDNLGRYLGVPSIHGRVHTDDFKNIIDRVTSRLDGWKMKYLSLASRHILAWSVLQSIPLYPMQSMLIPKGDCSKIEKTIRYFLWGGRDYHSSINLVKWEMVVKNKLEGDLGLRKMHEINLAFLTKLGWRMIQDKNSLWVKVLSGNYMKNKVQIKHVQPKHGSSNAW